MIRKLFSKVILILALIFCSKMMVSAQGGATPPPDPGDPVPITGIELLIGAGAFFGAKRLIDSRRAKQ